MSEPRKFHEQADATLWLADSRDLSMLPASSAQCCVTSPPYWLQRVYGEAVRQIGREEHVEAYVDAVVAVCGQVHRVLRDDGVLWLNLGDSYHRGELVGVPWLVVQRLRSAGWRLRSDIIWPRKSMERVKSRPTHSHEYLFMLTKSRDYYYDAAAIAEPGSGTDARPQYRRAKELAEQAGLTEAHIAAIRATGATDCGKTAATQSGTGRNRDEVRRLAGEAKAALGGYFREFLLSDKRNATSIWQLPDEPYDGPHCAVFPPSLPRRCILASTRAGDVVLDPFNGSGTTAQVAIEAGRKYVGVDVNADYLETTVRDRLGPPRLFAAAS